MFEPVLQLQPRSETIPRTFLFAGGGSGGHLMPGLAVAEELERRFGDVRIVFVGSGRPIEKTILDATPYEHIALPVEPSTMLRRNPVRFLTNTWNSVQAARSILTDTWPEVVIGVGGFASVPMVLAASTLRIPRILLEQNSVSGRATSWLSRTANTVCLSYAEAQAGLRSGARCVVTGNPVRRTIAELANTPIESNRNVILILGGSQGAMGVNQLATSALIPLRNRLAGWTIVHQTGQQEEVTVKSLYRDHGIKAEVRSYFNDLPKHYARAAFAITRAGATTLAELACASVPAICIPYPNSVRQHQRKNALRLEQLGATCRVEDRSDVRREETVAELTLHIDRLLTDHTQRQHMAAAMRTDALPHAAAAVVAEIEGCLRSREAA
ncbi:undecaprenyldiphospho-muramoylpentapeptide beta-N-acetylglucosaminyltransferase [Calycomorphotria hydatis]|uniref:UDP-N-acetylglucosamine--N-acetylmuramyl-(pentapeptide) pyrophosphoryl-undecaprenol N-acetylglucosamine transferase n=1 Tax=Calycomorphotria hydatis TaxID=2528027 RepID=A0A517TA96_9PLAN|nr:undecaprenyldiphospho-muramoylpentapeptide beta-N-acetylglucosaminyltransferase [Calycomorphotria hydatis]QDT65302.1 UDP-N-acetylglucosamine--N-acetylmuramyl-(pentapeptide) pyrophosphoryl-undecaprenol N-acetylglucosamine transferase MurG [Calycomorphotria hydatis]